jgi:CspA family cold shock protein
MMRGTVKWFNEAKQYGFIATDDGGVDFFVHKTDLVGVGTLREGEAVTFDLGSDQKGRTKAVNVRRAG